MSYKAEPAMKQIHLHGALGEQFGEDWTLSVTSPGEALRLINANCPRLAAHIAESGTRGVAYRVVVGDRDIEADDIERETDEVMHFVPVAAGAKSGFAQILIGAALFAGAVWNAGGLLALYQGAGGLTSAMLASSGTSLVIGGVSQLLVGHPDTDTQAAGEQKQSTGFGSVPGTAVQGAGVPVGYGTAMLTDPLLISNGIEAESVL